MTRALLVLWIISLVSLSSFASQDVAVCKAALTQTTEKLHAQRFEFLQTFGDVSDTADYMNAMVRSECRKYCEGLRMENGEEIDCFASQNAFSHAQKVVHMLNGARQYIGQRIPASDLGY